MTTLGVMTLVHHRHAYLRAIADCLVRMHMPIVWHIHYNQPTVPVLNEINNLLTEPQFASLNIEVFAAPFSPLDEKERFMELRQIQLERLPPTTHAVIWDDDHLLLDPKEAREKLQEDWDLIYATKLFFWGDDAHYTTHLPAHRSVFFFRRLAGDRFPLDRTIHAPARIHDSAQHITELSGPLLDYGYMSSSDRERCWLDYKRVGKIDTATLALVQEPSLVEWSGPFPLRDAEKYRVDALLDQVRPEGPTAHLALDYYGPL